MPVPPEFEAASDQFLRFLVAARDLADLSTTNQAYTMTQGVLQTFRRRLTVEQSIEFANVLPLLLRALYVTDWKLAEPRREFADVESMTKEVQGLRADHNWSPPNSIAAVAQALRPFVRGELFDEVLAKLPRGAAEFWRV